MSIAAQEFTGRAPLKSFPLGSIDLPFIPVMRIWNLYNQIEALSEQYAGVVPEGDRVAISNSWPVGSKFIEVGDSSFTQQTSRCLVMTRSGIEVAEVIEQTSSKGARAEYHVKTLGRPGLFDCISAADSTSVERIRHELTQFGTGRA